MYEGDLGLIARALHSGNFIQPAENTRVIYPKFAINHMTTVVKQYLNILIA